MTNPWNFVLIKEESGLLHKIARPENIGVHGVDVDCVVKDLLQEQREHEAESVHSIESNESVNSHSTAPTTIGPNIFPGESLLRNGQLRYECVESSNWASDQHRDIEGIREEVEQRVPNAIKPL